MPENFDIKQYIWLIILVAGILLLAGQTNFQYALGAITASIVKDGIILTAGIALVEIKFRKKKWQWHDWLNMLAYTTIAARLIYPFLA
mgnify:CR=1 FL=1